MFDKRKYRLLSALLCMSLCAGSPSINTLANEAEASETESSVKELSTESYNIVDETSEEEPAVEKSDSDESSSNESPSEESSVPESETENISQETATTESSTEKETGEDTTTEMQMTEESSSEEPTTEEPATEETTTEETTTEELTTEEALIVDLQRSSDIEEALIAFHVLLQEKQLMALLYHTDNYQVQRHAGAYDDPIAVIQSGHTLYITDAVILDDQIWYQVNFFVGGEEQTGYIEAYYLAYADEDWIAWESKYLPAQKQGKHHHLFFLSYTIQV